MTGMHHPRRTLLRRDEKKMKYLSSKPFTGGANSRAYVDRWEEIFGKKDPKAADPASRSDPPLCGVRVKERGLYRKESDDLDFLVDRMLESYRDPQPCDGSEDVSAAKDRIPFTAIDRQITMSVLERRLKEAYVDRQSLALTEEEIFSLVLLLKELREPNFMRRHPGGRWPP